MYRASGGVIEVTTSSKTHSAATGSIFADHPTSLLIPYRTRADYLALLLDRWVIGEATMLARQPLATARLVLRGDASRPFLALRPLSSTPLRPPQPLRTLRPAFYRHNSAIPDAKVFTPISPNSRFSRRHPFTSFCLRLGVSSALGVTLIVGTILLHDAFTYSERHADRVPANPLSLHPRLGGKKNLPIIESNLEDEQDETTRNLSQKPRLVIVGGGWGVSSSEYKVWIELTCSRRLRCSSPFLLTGTMSLLSLPRHTLPLPPFSHPLAWVRSKSGLWSNLSASLLRGSGDTT